MRVNFVKNGRSWTVEMYVSRNIPAREYCISWGSMGTRRNCERLARNQEPDVIVTWGGWPSFEEYRDLGDKPEPEKDYSWDSI